MMSVEILVAMTSLVFLYSLYKAPHDFLGPALGFSFCAALIYVYLSLFIDKFFKVEAQNFVEGLNSWL